MRRNGLLNSLSLILIIFILIIIPDRTGINGLSRSPGNINLAENLILAAGVEIKEIKLQVWGQIRNENLNSAYDSLRESLRLNSQYKVVQKENTGFCSIAHLEKKGEGSWQLCLQEITVPKKTKEKYISLLFTTNKVSYAGEVYDILKDILGNLGVEQEIGITFCGTINGKTSCVEVRKIADLIQGVAKAHYVEGFMKEELTSLSFYSAEIEGFLKINSHKINLNIAFSYNEEENSTYLYIGLPLIYQEY